MTDYLSLDFTGAKVSHQAGPTDWLAFIFEVNHLCKTGGADDLFGDPEIQPAGANPVARPYTEVYPQARIELGEGLPQAATIVATTEHAASVFRIAAERLNIPFDEPELDDPIVEIANVLAEYNASEWPGFPALALAKISDIIDAHVEASA